MKLPDEAIKEFQEIIKKEFGIDMPEDQASLRANDVLRLFYLFFLWKQEEAESAKSSGESSQPDDHKPSSVSPALGQTTTRQLTLF